MQTNTTEDKTEIQKHKTNIQIVNLQQTYNSCSLSVSQRNKKV